MEVEIKVISQKGVCAAGLKKGDRFIYKNNLIPPNICSTAIVAMFPHIKTLRYGGKVHWSEKDGSLLMACPDPKNPVVFSIRAIEK